MIPIALLLPGEATMDSRGVVSRLRHVPLGLVLLAALPLAASARELDLDSINRYARGTTVIPQGQYRSLVLKTKLRLSLPQEAQGLTI